MSLQQNERTPKTGLYCLRCVACGGFPIGCSCNITCGDMYVALDQSFFACVLLYVISFRVCPMGFPHMCCMWLQLGSDGTYYNIKGTANVVVVDKKSTLAYYEGMHCCYCKKC